ncbi:copper transporter [Brevibacillus borstelensis]|uniref:copper transporter n=1 Tax=Brevibacillus borstelensis TaxID=45462 RepID=UPI0004684940|nr:copper transporter [Brevibacillus borstelensis]MED1875025.1 copper transporter [Brevibacillus borstelensis]
MIPFRHHLISLVAVFFSLGIGILLGGMTGHSWFSFEEQAVLSKMETRYSQALKSNNELKQQLNRLLIEMERNNEEAAHLMAVRYADAMQGNKVYVWQSPELQIGRLLRLFEQVGVEIVPYGQGSAPLDGPILALGKTKPDWLEQLPGECRWLFVDKVPETFSQQWGLLDRVQKLMAEMRVEREKS